MLAFPVEANFVQVIHLAFVCRSIPLQVVVQNQAISSVAEHREPARTPAPSAQSKRPNHPRPQCIPDPTQTSWIDLLVSEWSFNAPARPRRVIVVKSTAMGDCCFPVYTVHAPIYRQTKHRAESHTHQHTLHRPAHVFGPCSRL